MQGSGLHAPAPPTSKGIGGLVRGVLAAVRGTFAAFGNRDVRVTYYAFTVVLVLTTMILSAAAIYGLWTATEMATNTESWIKASLWALRVAGVVMTLLVVPVLSLFIINLVLPLFAERIFFAGFRAIDPDRANALAAQPGLPLITSIGMTLVRLFYFLFLSILASLLVLIPVVGTVVGPAVQFWITAKVLGWELLDPYFDKHRMGFADQRAYLKTRGAAVTGFGLPYSGILLIPLIGPVFFGFFQAAASRLVTDVIDPSPPVA